MQHVLHLLESRDYVQVRELSEAFAVSEVTVRSDLTALARQGLVARIRGGVRALQLGHSEVGFDLRLRLEVERKRAIGRAAAAMVDEGRPWRSTRARRPITWRSSFVQTRVGGRHQRAARRDRSRRRARNYRPRDGGMLRMSAMSLVGDLGADVLRTTRINKGFLGARD